MVALAVFFVSGLRPIDKIPWTYSPPICGPVTDENGNLIDNAGPCPPRPSLPPPTETYWVWEPVWEWGD
jgi:hypothetical protein